MSTQRKPEFIEEEISEQAIKDYLAAHPDFFERHSALLSSLQLPHGSSGTVSLVERQVSMLRQKELRQQRQLKELIEVARANDVLSAKIHELTLQLFAAHDLHTSISCIEEAMRSGFGADQSVLVHFGDPTLFEASSIETTMLSSHLARSCKARAPDAARCVIPSASSCSVTTPQRLAP